MVATFLDITQCQVILFNYEIGSNLIIILFAGLPNGGIPQEGGLFSDRRPGRRGRRHKGPTKLSDGKYPPLTSEKEDSNAGQPRYAQNSNGGCGIYC